MVPDELQQPEVRIAAELVDETYDLADAPWSRYGESDCALVDHLAGQLLGLPRRQAGVEAVEREQVEEGGGLDNGLGGRVCLGL